METEDQARLVATTDLRSRVNEKLLQALLGLLVLKDENLLQELCIVFDTAQQAEGAIPSEVWRGVYQHLDALKALAAVADDQPTH